MNIYGDITKLSIFIDKSKELGIKCKSCLNDKYVVSEFGGKIILFKNRYESRHLYFSQRNAKGSTGTNESKV